MKIRIFLWFFLFCCSFSTYAWNENQQNKGKEIDSLTFTIDLEDEDGIYLSPQSVAFTVQSVVTGKESTLGLICIVTTDTYRPVDSLAWLIKPDSLGRIRQKISLDSLDAGFYRISIYAKNEKGKSLPRKFNIGYNPEQIVSPPDAKADFADFWKNTRGELDKVKPHYKMTLLKEKCSDLKDMYHVEMYSFGNVKIEGCYSVPKKKGKHPAIIRYMGYASGPRFPDPNVLPDYCEFILSVRGQGMQKSVNTYGEWIVNGLSDKNTYYYRGAYMDLIRGIDFLASRPEINAQKIMAEGGSQGGAFTLIACALDKRIKAAAPRIPFLSDFQDYFSICPWPRSLFENYLKEHPSENWEKVYDLLTYFDVKNFAAQITCPIIMGVGLQDETCPPHTNFAGYNLINSEKKYVVYPEQKHSVDNSWWLLRENFLKEKIKE